MRSFRLDFTGGVDVVGDKAVLSPGYMAGLNRTMGDKTNSGYCTVMDNVELRSGQPRAINAPELHSELVVPITTPPVTRIYSYRGKWHYSSSWRDYVSTLLNGHERVMFTEYPCPANPSGTPQKVIDGIQVPLGTITPFVCPLAAPVAALTPSVSLSQGTGGGYANNTMRSYRVGVETINGILPASPSVNVMVNNGLVATTAVPVVPANTAITVSWSPVPTALYYHLYAGNGSSELEIGKFNSGTTSFVDAGSGYGYGTSAKDFDNASPYTYFSTFVRQVNTVTDESGPSPISSTISSTTGRQITFDPNADGFLGQPGGVTIASGITLTPSSTYISALTVQSIYPNLLLGEVAFETTSAHGFSNGDLQQFLGFTDPLWSAPSAAIPLAPLAVTIDPTDPKRFYVPGMTMPLDCASGNTTTVTAVGNSLVIPVASGTITSGMLVAGAGVTAGTTVSSVTNSGVAPCTVTLSANTTSNPAGIISFTPTGRTIQPAKTLVTLSGAPTIPVSSLLYNSTTPSSSVQDVVYMAVTDGIFANAPTCYPATYISGTSFWIPLYTKSSPSAPSLSYVPGNGYITYRNLYRTGDSSGWFLVKQLPISTLSFFDTMPATSLGNAPTSYYLDNGVTVQFSQPPNAMVGLTEHYGMLFGIVGNNVQWTPIGMPDAWPVVFQKTFAYQPLALKSYAGALIVLCQDGIYRIDGNEPASLSINKTKAENGCIAPYSVQATHAGLIYLSRRGLMLFDGMNATCITEARLPYTFFSGSSSLPTPVPFWWYPTLQTYNYHNLATADGILGSALKGVSYSNTNPAGDNILAVRSFYHGGKYYIYWSLSVTGYDSNTCVCLDLQLPGYPITTLGMKPLDVHVDDTERAYCLFNNALVSSM